MKDIRNYIIVGLVCSALTIGAYKILGLDKNDVVIKEVQTESIARLSANNEYGTKGALPVDFTYAAEMSTPAVVHIKSTVVTQAGGPQGRNPMGDLFGQGNPFYHQMPRGPQKAQSSGSGVIISEDGYIVTNNHVVENANEIEVTLNDQRTFKAKVIGTDPTTDLALIQIRANGLAHLAFGNSDDVKIGEWVLAVGNPFNLESTVTAGIVSAKGRNINILKENYAIESFIQTDAAVNPGNSGGALTNLKGELVGINTAIATPTGTYAGYSFAVPSAIVKKVTEDLIKYGSVQRGILGVMIRNMDGNMAKEMDLEMTEGAYVDSVMSGSAAEDAGIMKGDVIVKVEDKDIKNASNLQENIGRHRPGEKVDVRLFRDGKEKVITVELKNRSGEKTIVKKSEKEVLEILGAELKELEDSDLKKLNIESGVEVSAIRDGKIRRETDMKEGFIILKINGDQVSSKEGVERKLKSTKGGVMLEGIYPDFPGTYYYAFGME